MCLAKCMKLSNFLTLTAFVFLLTMLLCKNPIAAPQPKGSVKANLVTFKLESFDGNQFYNCVHAVANPNNPYDLSVKCSDKKGNQKQFIVHLALSRYRHQTAPKVSYELLYWVDGNGASSWYHFDEETKLMKTESSQSIPGLDAALKLSITLQ